MILKDHFIGDFEKNNRADNLLILIDALKRKLENRKEKGNKHPELGKHLVRQNKKSRVSKQACLELRLVSNNYIEGEKRKVIPFEYKNKKVFMALVATEVGADAWGLSHHLGPCWCPKAILAGAMMI